MKPPKLGSFAERQAHSAEAKKALVAKFKPKPTIVDHGDLTDLTALLHHGTHLDATFVSGTPLTAVTISGP